MYGCCGGWSILCHGRNRNSRCVKLERRQSNRRIVRFIWLWDFHGLSLYIHHSNDNGVTFKYLTGEIATYYGKFERAIFGNWRNALGLNSSYAKYYEIPFRILLQEKIDNIIPVGRMIHADEGAFGALRVMVNLNQLGEAAGTAAYVLINESCCVSNVNGRQVQRLLREGGSLL